MNNQEKLDFIKTTIDSRFGIRGDVSPESNLIELGLDSLDIVELQIYYEEQFSCELPDPENPILTIRDLMDIM